MGGQDEMGVAVSKLACKSVASQAVAMGVGRQQLCRTPRGALTGAAAVHAAPVLEQQVRAEGEGRRGQARVRDRDHYRAVRQAGRAAVRDEADRGAPCPNDVCIALLQMFAPCCCHCTPPPPALAAALAPLTPCHPRVADRVRRPRWAAAGAGLGRAWAAKRSWRRFATALSS